MTGPLLALLVDVHLARGDLEGPSGRPGGWSWSPGPAEVFSEQNVGRILANA